MPYCAVNYCTNSSKVVTKAKEGISFYSFPKEPNLKEKWIDATGNTNWFPSKNSTICSVHFDEDCLVQKLKKRVLTKTAYPTIRIPKTPANEDKKASLSTDIVLPFKMTEKRKLVKKLDLAQQKIKEQNKQIKRLREQNRRKIKKILVLMSVVTSLKKKCFVRDEQANNLPTIKVENIKQEVYSDD